MLKDYLYKDNFEIMFVNGYYRILSDDLLDQFPLGVFGNGTAQTKSHFVASLLNSDPSTVQNLEGPADSFKNAFILK